MEKEIEVNGKKFVVRELLNSEIKKLPTILEIDSPEVKTQKNEEIIKQETILASGITEEEYNKLTRKEFLTIRMAILKLNTPDQDFWATN